MSKTDPIIDSDFPGGNIVVDSVDGDLISLHQELRDTTVDWFYWYFRIRGAAGRTLEFRFTASDAIGVRGPAVSVDDGGHWSWLGAEAVRGQSFTFTIPPQADAVHFSFTIPYLEAHLQAFLARYSRHPHLRIGTLCRTKGGRDVEMLHLGHLDGSPDLRVLMIGRHHACEAIATYSMEGMLEAVLTQTGPGAWLREHVEFLVIPFMDKDGVEEGDQGKRRRPYDHWEDYGEGSIYPTVQAVKKRVPAWSEGKLRFILDFHCPAIRGGSHERIHFVGGPDQENWRRVERFCAILEQTRTGPLPYRVDNNLAYGDEWNVDYEPRKTSERWGEALPEVLASSVVEIPYANVDGEMVTPESARAFGWDLATALQKFLAEPRI